MCLACLDLCSCTHIARRKGKDRIKNHLVEAISIFFTNLANTVYRRVNVCKFARLEKLSRTINLRHSSFLPFALFKNKEN